MDKHSALAILGLEGEPDEAAVNQAYYQRSSEAQLQLHQAPNETLRREHLVHLSQLGAAYTTLVNPSTRAANLSGPNLAADENMPKPGSVLSGRHEIGSLLGCGGMGHVYTAYDRLKNETVAIKVLRPDLMADIDARERFLAEARVSCKLSHPNIVRVHDVGTSDGCVFLSMERLEGQTLRQVISERKHARRPFSAKEVGAITAQLLDALEYAHQFIVHRDIKPENIWLTLDGQVKLMDFGIARIHSTQLTQTGVLLGTAYYMAPEQRLSSKDVDWRADQYSLGVVIYEMLTGNVPMGALTQLEQLRRDVPKGYARAVMRTLSPQREGRFASMSELRVALNPALPSTATRRKAAAIAIVSTIAAAAVAAAVVKSNPGARLSSTERIEQSAAKTDSATPQTSKHKYLLARHDPRSPTTELFTIEDKAGTPVVTKHAQSATSSSRSETIRVASAAQRTSDCVQQCEMLGTECRSLMRRGRQECMRAVGFGATSARPSSADYSIYYCDFFRADHCEDLLGGDSCRERMTGRYSVCTDVTASSIADGRNHCEQSALSAEQLCIEEVRDCRASCQDRS